MIEAVSARPPGSLQELYLQAGQSGGQLSDPPAADVQAFDAAMERLEVAQAQIEPSTGTDVVAPAADNPWIVPPSVSGADGPADTGLGLGIADTMVEVRDLWDSQRTQVDSLRLDAGNMSQAEMLGMFYDISHSTVVFSMVTTEVGQVDSKIDRILRTA